MKHGLGGVGDVLGRQADGVHDFGGSLGALGDGVDDHAEIPLDISPSLRPQITMGAWARPDVVDNTRRAVMASDDGGWDRTHGSDDGDWMGFLGNGYYRSGKYIDHERCEWFIPGY